MIICCTSWGVDMKEKTLPGSELIRLSSPPPPQWEKRVVPCKDHAEIRYRYFRPKDGLAKNLPIPSVKTDIANHACLDPLDCVKNLLAHGIPIGPIGHSSSTHYSFALKPYSWITETPRARELKDLALGVAATRRSEGTCTGEELIILPAFSWQDDFDPNNSTKNNRGSVWTQTLTIAPPRDRRNNPLQTYPVAIGKSKDNSHDAVQTFLRGRLQELSQEPVVVYSKSHGKPVAVMMFVYAILQDQPERRKDLMTAPGNANYHGRFNYSTHTFNLLPVLRTCDSCRTSLRGGTLPRMCPNCVCWDVAQGLKPEAPKEILDKLKLELPYGYPMTHLDNDQGIQYLTEDNRILPFQMTTDRLKCSFRLAFDNLVNRNWKNSTFFAFVKRENFKEDLIQDLLKKASNTRALQEILSGRVIVSSVSKNAILEDAKQFPDQYRRPETPKSWDVQGGLSVYVDVLMHLLFLGIVKSTLGTIRLWLCKQGKHAAFHRHTDEFNKRLKELHLDWLKCEEFRDTGKFGGWVSENFLGFSRILKWFFQNIPDLTADEATEPPPGLPINKWKKAHFVYWLRVRGKRNDGTVLVLKNRVMALLNEKGGPPPVLHSVAGDYEPEQVERMLVALDEMLSSIMVDEVVPGVTVPTMELKIKTFLTEFDLLDQQLKTPKDKPKVVTSFNYMCLLNLPALTERFGPLRNLWEGSYKGEGYIGKCKSFLRNGQKTNFECHAMTNVLTEMSLEQLTDGMTLDLDCRKNKREKDNAIGRLSSFSSSIKIYTDRTQVVDSICEKRIVSVVVGVNKKSKNTPWFVFGVFGVGHRNLEIVKISELAEYSTIQKMGCSYTSWLVGETCTSTQLDDLLCNPAKWDLSFGVLLPLLDPSQPPKHTLVLSARYNMVQ